MLLIGKTDAGSRNEIGLHTITRFPPNVKKPIVTNDGPVLSFNDSLLFNFQVC